MRLKEILETLVEGVPGANAAVLADWEGEAVVAYSSGENTDYQIKFVGAHQGILLERAKEMIERLSLGRPEEFTFLMENMNVITVPVNKDYYIVLTLTTPYILPQSKLLVKKAAREIERDIA